MNSWVHLEIVNKVANIQISRGEEGNALNRKLIEDLCEVLQQLQQLEFDLVVISANGNAFCVGGDIKHFSEHQHRLAQELNYMVSLMHQAIQTLAGLDTPVIVAAHGSVGGGGLGLLWCADYVVASEDAKFATGYIDIGLSSDGGNSWYLPKLIGMNRAKRMLLDNEVINANQAFDWGLISKVVAQDDMDKAVASIANRFRSRSCLAIKNMKQLLRREEKTSLLEHLDLELNAILQTGETTEVKQGISKYVNRS